MSDSQVELFCPACDGPVTADARRCPYCNEPFERPKHRKGLNGLIWVGVFCLAWCGPGAVGLTIAFSPPPVSSNIVTGSMVYGFGLVLAVAGVVVGWFDLRMIRAGRLNPERRTGTLVGLWMCGIAMVLYWCAAGYHVAALF